MKKFLSLILVFCILNVSLINRSEAVVGLFLNSKTTRVTGGIIAATSMTSATLAGSFYAIYGYSYSALVFATFGFLGSYVGLILLDEKNGNLNFMPLSDKMAKKLKINKTELVTYNSEVEELNTIKEVIESQVNDDADQSEITDLWNQYKNNLSPETMKVASKIISEIFNRKFILIK